MKRVNCRRLFGKIILLSTGLLFVSNPSFAQASAVYDSSSSNLGAYEQFDLGSTLNYASVHATAGGDGNVGVGSSANQGSFDKWSDQRNEAAGQKTQSSAKKTANQHVRSLPRTASVTLDRVFGGGRPLPATVLDSFVYAAAGSADQIYGDEGATDLPPFFGFDQSHRIERGITSVGLTTGHPSLLPEAWGWPN